ncbi:MAG TPA: hypothetical protein VNL14_00680 [Candidatus Acidoferrales bacterium]|nr:hypothetical protein [Candidatus Acidoferrales bacterium]
MTASAHTMTLRYCRRASKIFASLDRKAAAFGYCVLALGACFALNWAYQVMRKPAEIFAPLGDSLSKSYESTWRTYGKLFEEHSTDVLSPEFLAALAQVEGAGNPVASTYWRWQWSWNPFEIYRPASSAVGMFQITDGTFAEARKYCVRSHKVMTEGAWYDLNSCWFNRLYSRIIPSHAIEMTAAYLHQAVSDTLAAQRTAATLAQKQKLAAVIHLCGPKRGERFVKQRFRVSAGERCGSHGVRDYLSRVERAKQRFARLKNATEN